MLAPRPSGSGVLSKTPAHVPPLVPSGQANVIADTAGRAVREGEVHPRWFGPLGGGGTREEGLHSPGGTGGEHGGSSRENRTVAGGNGRQPLRQNAADALSGGESFSRRAATPGWGCGTGSYVTASAEVPCRPPDPTGLSRG